MSRVHTNASAREAGNHNPGLQAPARRGPSPDARWAPAPHFPWSFSQIAMFPPTQPGAPRIQPKLKIGSISDPLEQEADRLAEQVMRIPDGAAAREGNAGAGHDHPAIVRRLCRECEEEQDEEKVRRKPAPGLAPRWTSLPDERSLAIGGDPLPAPIRHFYEMRFDHDFRDVRIHSGAAAETYNKALHSYAFTYGNHIWMGTGQPVARTPLLAHELAHVVQQRPSAAPRFPLRVSEQGERAERDADQVATNLLAGRAIRPSQATCETAIYRAPDDRGVAPPPVMKPETVIRRWLDQHQFAPPDNQPEEGEKHVLLNGEEMKISEAVKLASAGTSQPPELVNSVITSMLVPTVAAGLAGLPFIGQGNQVPGIRLGERDAFGINPAIAKTVEYSKIDDYLQEHGFQTPEVRDPNAIKVLFDGKETTVDWVVDRAMALLGQYPTLMRSEVVTYIRQKYVAARGGPSNQIVFGYTLIPKQLQYVGGPDDPYNPLKKQHQFSFTITRQHHAGDSPGLETSFQGSLALDDQGRIVNMQAGGQEAIVLPLLNGWIQLSGLVQVMAGANWNKSATGQTVIAPALQSTLGGQALLTPVIRSGDWKFLTGHVQLGVQALGGVQTSFQQSSSTTVPVANVGFVLNIPF